MPPLPPANKILKVRFIGRVDTNPWNCILHSQYTSASPTEADLSAFATAAGNAWGTNIGPLCSSFTNLASVDVVDLSSATSPSATELTPHPGSRVGTPPPAQVCLVSSWHANLRYRGGHPRNYWPAGVGTDLASLSTWSSTSITAFQAGFAAFRTAMNAIPLAGSTTQLVLLSYKSGGAFRPTPVPVTITGVTVHPRVDTQRRRLGKETT